MMRGDLLASLLCCSMLASAASAAAAASAPDLSGAWARTTFELEPPASGPGPLRDAPRGSDAPPAYTSPLLKPAAAAIVKQRYESVQAGKPYPLSEPDPANSELQSAIGGRHDFDIEATTLPEAIG